MVRQHVLPFKLDTTTSQVGRPVWGVPSLPGTEGKDRPGLWGPGKRRRVSRLELCASPVADAAGGRTEPGRSSNDRAGQGAVGAGFLTQRLVFPVLSSYNSTVSGHVFKKRKEQVDGKSKMVGGGLYSLKYLCFYGISI